MFYSSLKTLIACATSNDEFSNTIESVAERLGADFLCVPDFASTLQKCFARQSSCVVVDYESAQWQTVNNLQSQPVLVVVAEGDVQAAFQAARTGALNVIEKPLRFDELIVNLQSALAYESELEAFLIKGGRFESESFRCLSEREKAILSLLMDGEPNKRVAARLDIGLRTVEAERATIMKKLSVSSFVELIKLVSGLEKNLMTFKNEIFARNLSRAQMNAA